ncbi:hypothetical protein KFE25_007282 [Diacronema lutheri]|uniref:Uncharacterized protein n=1 Tax=Diacronema lutheri TaxID=2081491 RepID=A0A8J5XQZ7_DIALT|nr:hypothetical protein KFE25_007282 [Diacronema lutheri]
MLASPGWRQLIDSLAADPAAAVPILLDSGLVSVRKLMASGKLRSGQDPVHLAARASHCLLPNALSTMLRRNAHMSVPLSASTDLTAADCSAFLLGDRSLFSSFLSLAKPLLALNILLPSEVDAASESFFSAHGTHLVSRVDTCMRELFAAPHYEAWSGFCADVLNLMHTAMRLPGVGTGVSKFVFDSFSELSHAVATSLTLERPA